MNHANCQVNKYLQIKQFLRGLEGVRIILELVGKKKSQND